MNQLTSHYIITATDKFHAWNFPEINKEIDMIRTQVKNLRKAEHCAVIISFFKDHKIRMDLAQSQTILVEILLSMNPCRYISDLFESSKENKPFQMEFENYLTKELGA